MICRAMFPAQEGGKGPTIRLVYSYGETTAWSNTFFCARLKHDVSTSFQGRPQDPWPVVTLRAGIINGTRWRIRYPVSQLSSHLRRCLRTLLKLERDLTWLTLCSRDVGGLDLCQYPNPLRAFSLLWAWGYGVLKRGVGRQLWSWASPDDDIRVFNSFLPPRSMLSLA